MKTTGSMKFVCQRTRQIYIVEGCIALLLFMAMGVSYLNDKHNDRARTTGFACIVLAVIAAWFLIEGLRSSAINVSGSTLHYRTIWRTKTFDKREIRSVESVIRMRAISPRKFQIPKVNLKDGSEYWFFDFAVPPVKRSDDSAESKQQAAMVAQIDDWLR